MQCPFRKIIHRIDYQNGFRTEILYGNCYEDECPYWGIQHVVFNPETREFDKKVEPGCRKTLPPQQIMCGFQPPVPLPEYKDESK